MDFLIDCLHCELGIPFKQNIVEVSLDASDTTSMAALHSAHRILIGVSQPVQAIWNSTFPISETTAKKEPSSLMVASKLNLYQPMGEDTMKYHLNTSVAKSPMLLDEIENFYLYVVLVPLVEYQHHCAAMSSWISIYCHIRWKQRV